MPGILIRWMIIALAVTLIPHLVSGVRVDGAATILLASAVLGILNALVRPLLVILTLPLTIFTLGFFILVINALLFLLAAKLVPGLHVDSFWSAFWGAIIISIVSWIMSSVVTGGGGERTVIVRRWNDSVDMRRGRGGRWE